MFYRTQIKSVTGSVVVDKDGKNLQFMGYLPVKAGDWVFTDGKFIFGNVPPRGSPAVFAEVQSGIPVLADDLRGYFAKNGSFRNYAVAQDDWIVNSEKTFNHGSNKIDDKKIIDAEVARNYNGNEIGIYTVEKSNKEFATIDEDTDYIYRTQRKIGSYPAYFFHETLSKFADSYFASIVEISDALLPTISSMDADFFKFDNAIFKDSEIIIKKDGSTLTTLVLSQFCETCEEDASKLVNFIEVPTAHTEDHVKSRAVLKNFKVLPDGKWEAIVLSEVWAERSFSFESVISHSYPIVTRQGGSITIVKDIEVYIETIYASSMACCLKLFKITSENEETLLWNSSTAYPLRTSQRSFETGYGIPIELKTSPDAYPYVTVFGQVLRYDVAEYINPDGTIPGIPAATWFNINSEGRYMHENTITMVYDSRNLPNAPNYDGTTFAIAENFSFPVQDNFQAKIINSGAEAETWQLEGIYDGSDQKIIGGIDSADAHKWNMSCAPLRGGGYLFGVHEDEDRDIGGVLYKIDRDGNVEPVGTGLKNFRLRELKNITKARR